MNPELPKIDAHAAHTAHTSLTNLSIPLDKTAKQVGELVKKAIRDLAFPYEQNSNPCANEVQKRTIEWLNKHKIILTTIEPVKIQKIEASNFGNFLGRVHPRATLEILSIVSDFATWLFIYDDMIEDKNDKQEIEKLHERTISIISGKDVVENDTPLTHGLHDIMNRINKVCRSTIWKQRFLQDVRDYCEGTLWELSNREQKKVPSLDQYKKMRPNTSGTKIMFDFVEIVEGFTIPENIFVSEFFKKMRLLGANLVNWENDLLSAPKELLKHDLHNLVFVYKEEFNTTYDTAVTLVMNDLKTNLAKFQKRSDAIPDFGDETENVKKYILGVKEWIGGHHFWAKESPRYVNYFS